MLLSICACNKSDYQKIRLNEVTHSVFMLPICSFKFRLFEEEGLEIELTTGQEQTKL